MGADAEGGMFDIGRRACFHEMGSTKIEGMEVG